MNCRLFLSWLETGAAATRPEAARHAASCARCSATLRAADEVDAFLAEFGGEPAAGFTDRVMARVPERTGRSPVPRDATAEARGTRPAPQRVEIVRQSWARSRRLMPSAFTLIAFTLGAIALLAIAEALLAIRGIAGPPLPARAVSIALRDAAGALARAGLTAGFAGRIPAEGSAGAGLVLMLLPSIVLASRALSGWISARIAGEPASPSSPGR
jgi:hypothetical protein